MTVPGKGGRRKVIRTEDQKAGVIVRLANGESQADIARDLDCGRSTVCNFAKANADEIREKQLICKQIATDNVLERLETAVRAQMEAASDPTCRHGPQALRAAVEAAGLSGRDFLVHVGDQFNATVDASQHLHVEFTDEDRAQLEAYQRKHGIAEPKRAERLAEFKKKHGMA